MKKLIFLVLLSGISVTYVAAQDQLFPEIPKEIYDKANVAKDMEYLTVEEKQVIYLVNLARLDGNLFAKTYLTKYVKEKSLDQTSNAIASLFEDLKTSRSDILVPTEKLFKTAKFHAEDSGKKGLVGHDSSDGTPFGKRLRSHGIKGAIAENCSYGFADSEGIMMQLLIDETVPSRGHRKNILNPDYKSIGVSIHQHEKWSYTCVQDFSTTVQ